MKENSILQTLSSISGPLGLPIAVVTIVKWLFDIPLDTYLWILAVLLVISLGAFVYIERLKPWSAKLRPALFRIGSRRLSLKEKIKMRLRRPLYEIDYQGSTKGVATVELSPELGAFFDKKTTVIIEDDPVGFNCDGFIPAFAIGDRITQHDLRAYFDENSDAILAQRIFFVATPSRRLDSEHAKVINQHICSALDDFFRTHNREYRIIGKIDSCLRSNYESEYRGAVGGTGGFDLEVLVPAYVEEGRVTVWGTQYILSPDRTQPMHKTEYCYFNGLEYSNSNISLWLEKKTNGRIRRNQVGLVDIEMLRTLSAREIYDRYSTGGDIRALVFDSICESDSVSVLNALIELDSGTARIFYKLSASLINVIVRNYALQNQAHGNPESAPVGRGVIVVGSLSTITKKQVRYIHNDIDVSQVLIYNADIESDQSAEKKKDKIAADCRRGMNIILTTEFWENKSTKYPSLEKRDASLRYFAKIIEKIKNDSRWFLFVGSDTALYSALYGLGIRQFHYCGHIIPGVIRCVFRYPDEGHYRTFFINGGNNGGEDLFRRLLNKLESTTLPQS